MGRPGVCQVWESSGEQKKVVETGYERIKYGEDEGEECFDMYKDERYVAGRAVDKIKADVQEKGDLGIVAEVNRLQ